MVTAGDLLRAEVAKGGKTAVRGGLMVMMAEVMVESEGSRRKGNPRADALIRLSSSPPHKN